MEFSRTLQNEIYEFLVAPNGFRKALQSYSCEQNEKQNKTMQSDVLRLNFWIAINEKQQKMLFH